MIQDSENERYCKELANQLAGIIQNSAVADADIRHILEQLFNNLSEYQAEKMSVLENNYLNAVKQLEKSSEQPDNIYTALIPNDKLKDFPNFYPVAEPGEIADAEGEIDSLRNKRDFAGIYFRCSYDRFIEITDSHTFQREYEAEIIENGAARNVMCRLIRNNVYVAKEKYLQQAAIQYNFDVPLIFSPYARRFAEIVFSEPVSISSLKHISIKGLEKDTEATTLEKTLVWNIEMKRRGIPELPDNTDDSFIKRIQNQPDLFSCNEYVVPNISYTYRSVYKCRKNEWILFNGTGASRLAVIRKISDDKLYVMYDADAKAEPFMRLSIYQPDETELQKTGLNFQNYYKRTVFRKKRLNTIADIQYAVSGFRNSDMNITIDEKIIVGKNPENEISDYLDMHRYYQYISYRELNETELHRSIPLKIGTACCLTFHGEVWYTEDYARYVLSWLNEQYPELIWIGRCEI